MPRRSPTTRALDSVLRELRRRRLIAGPIVLLALAGLYLLDQRGLLLHPGDDWDRYEGRRFTVQRVVDGDTLLLEVPDGAHRATRVRVWGIDSPELARPQEGKPAEPWAEDSRDHAKALCEARTVTLTLERHRIRDRYERLLAHVQLDTGELLSEQLLLRGLTRADDRWDHRHRDRFAALEAEARRQRVGLWE